MLSRHIYDVTYVAVTCGDSPIIMDSTIIISIYAFTVEMSLLYLD